MSRSAPGSLAALVALALCAALLAAPSAAADEDEGALAASDSPLAGVLTTWVDDAERGESLYEGLGELAELSVLVVDADGRSVIDLDADDPRLPASTTKLVTAAAAWRLLGPDYRYVTRVHATGLPDDGVLDGDLVVAGSGDPALASPAYAEEVFPDRPHTLLHDLAEAVADAGVEEVTGRVRADVGGFADEPAAQGWPERYLASLDATLTAGLTVDGGRRLLERSDVTVAELAEDPALEAATVLSDLLDEAGVEVAGDPAQGSVPLGAVELARVQSPPLEELLAHVVQRSDNAMADGIFRSLGVATGEGTWEGSEAAVIAALGGLDVDWSDAALRDGSGLSRDNRLSATQLVALDAALREREGAAWDALMAVAGESGTLRRRWVGTDGEGRIRGKTGHLRDVTALVAHVEGGPSHQLAVLAQGPWEGLAAARELTDLLAEALAIP